MRKKLDTCYSLRIFPSRRARCTRPNNGPVTFSAADFGSKLARIMGELRFWFNRKMCAKNKYKKKYTKTKLIKTENFSQLFPHQKKTECETFVCRVATMYSVCVCANSFSTLIEPLCWVLQCENVMIMKFESRSMMNGEMFADRPCVRCSRTRVLQVVKLISQMDANDKQQKS